MPSVYSPQLRTAVVFSGTGTAGAYHAGALKALTQAGLRIDVMAGRGVGAVTALFAAVDLGAKLWEPDGVWRKSSRSRGLYRWRWSWRAAAWLTTGILVIVGLPAIVMMGMALAYPVSLVLQLVGGEGGTRAARAVAGWAAIVLDPAWYGLWIPRAVTMLLLLVSLLTAGWQLRTWVRARRRGRRGQALWRLVGTPLDGSLAKAWLAEHFWHALRGPASVPQPTAADLSQRYVELLVDNLGQPGYRELMLVVHDVDVRRDVVCALLEPSRRTTYFDAGLLRADHRAAELIDLAGLGRHLLFDAMGGALSVPLMTEPGALHHAVDSYWRGETHRVHDRPAAIVRLLEELSAAGVEQVIVVSADPAPGGPHALREVVAEPRGLAGEWLASEESAAQRDATTVLFDRFSAVFHVRPMHNPLGPFEFDGTYDARSDRTVDLAELVERGYEDAYRQVVEAIVVDEPAGAHIGARSAAKGG